MSLKSRPRSRTGATLWTCPRCGHRFVTRNLWHSCGTFRLAEHFMGRDPAVRRLFDRFRRLVRRCGPVTVYAQKTRIVFQAAIRFAGCTARRDGLDIGLLLARAVPGHAVRRIEFIPPRYYVHHLRITSPEQLDVSLSALVRESYAVGRRAHLRPATRP